MRVFIVACLCLNVVPNHLELCSILGESKDIS